MENKEDKLEQKVKELDKKIEDLKKSVEKQQIWTTGLYDPFGF